VALFYLWPRHYFGVQKPFAILFAGWFVAIYLLGVWRGLGDQGSGVVQVKLTAVGVRQGTRGVGALPYKANENGKLVPWRKVKEVQFGWREWYGEIRLSNSHGFWRFNLYREYVNINFACSRGEFIEMRKRVRQWLVQNHCEEALQYMTNHLGSAALPGGAMSDIA
jgi:hypothetical protein